jgi:hypothetical protein
MTQPTAVTRSTVLLFAAPMLLVAAFVVWLISDELLWIGPFDRAQIGWGVVVPLFVLAPGAAALAGRRAGGRTAAGHVIAIATTLAALTVIGLVATATRIGCAPVAGPLDVLPSALPVGIAAGLGFAVPAAAAWSVRRRGSLVALAFGAIVATILVWAASFIVGVSCAYVPPG